MRLPTIAAFAALIPLAALDEPAPRNIAPAAVEILRAQHHFDGALALLAARDLSSLSNVQRVNRRALSRTLTSYRDRGVFPHNYDFPESPTPYFIDRKTGTLCAVAYLMESTGRRDIVDRVASMDNNVWVAELAGDREFRGWLDEQGLTLAEAARIQMPYRQPPPDPVANLIPESSRRVGPADLATLVAATSFAAWNGMVGSSGRVATTLGFATGVLALTSGLALKEGNALDPSVSSVSIITGALGVVAAARSTWLRRLDARVTPIIPVGSNGSAGLSFSLTF